MQQAARTAAHLLAAAHSWLVFSLGSFEAGETAIVDGKPAIEGDETLDLVTWTRARILSVADGVLAEASTQFLAEAQTDPAEALASYVREDWGANDG